MKLNAPSALIANALLFEVGWFICVLAGSLPALISTLVILVIHFKWIGNWRTERDIILITWLLGSALDSFLVQMNIIQLPTPSLLIPLWLSCLWILFATLLNHCLKWLQSRPLLSMALAPPFAALSYFAGSQLTLVTIDTTGLVTIGICWAVLFPLLLSFAELFSKKSALTKS
ncbi:DUF2878 domain-containing protein [Zooshikella ganghwensis]|uniref:DUF2878 domain-containing protein n=1 Tax=Zooshikella ganghwensis TaxID=202772 RepID=A0A4P9VJ93_9GAMM|nr:DUF2878 domain-containing protein [Zooshikella ganghwensis]RDH43325.1 DUF2878 domain-containing protein [Zooshikella ganghwensis]